MIGLLLDKKIFFITIFAKIKINQMIRNMSEQYNIISVYASLFSAARKKRLLSVYREYISLVRNMEHIVRRYKPSVLAAFEVQKIYDNKAENNPWLVEGITEEEKGAYHDFLSVQKPNVNKHYCFVSLNYTSPLKNISRLGIISSPQNYEMQVRKNDLPCRIERYVAAFKQDEQLSEAKFIIDGKYVMTYSAATKQAVSDIFNTPAEEKKFSCMLDIMSQFSGNLEALSNEGLHTAQSETMASELTAPFENMILAALASLAEEADKILRDIPTKNKSGNYLIHAENNSAIPSAARMQEFLNIRHLLHHQWDTLDNIGRFTSFDNDRNFSIRERYLAAYCQLCDKPLSERLNAYIAAAADFSLMVSSLNPELKIRAAGETNTKFINRIKEYVRQNPKTPLWVEMAYAETAEKKAPLLKNLKKLFPAAQVIDCGDMDMESFIARISLHLKRKNYLDIFQSVEYQISQHFLLRGRSQPPLKSWRDLLFQKIITPEEAKQWSMLKKLRNDLSHQGMNDELSQRLDEAFPLLFHSMRELEKRLSKLYPQVYQIQGNIVRAVHKDGMVVELDFLEKRVLSVTSKNGISQYKEMDKRAAARKYTEEYRNGLSITTAGTEIISCRLPNGLFVNFKKGCVVYPDNAVLRINGDEMNCLVSGDMKLITDKEFKVQNFIRARKAINVAKNDVLALPRSRKITIGPDNRLKTDNWYIDDATSYIGEFSYTAEGTDVKLQDGTALLIKDKSLSLRHNGITLTYADRQRFAASYEEAPVKKFSKAKDR